MEPLNPTLYQALAARFANVKIFKGEEMNTHRTAPNWHRAGKLQRKVVTSGQYFAVCCPFCGDQRFRLWINYEWGVRDPLSGDDRRHLVRCYNEDCVNDRPRQLQLKKMLEAFDEVGTVATAGVGVDAWPTPPSEPTLPTGSVPVTELPPGHPAVAYLTGRNFDVHELWERWRVHYAEHSPLTRPSLTKRLVIPIYQPTSAQDKAPRLAGWAARIITTSPNADVKKYLFNAGLRASHLLYGLPAALPTTGPVVVVEGPTDVWRAGPGAVALLGKSLSPAQRVELLRLARGRPVVVLLDRDAGAEARKVRDSLRGGRASEQGEKRVVVATVPAGVKDPGDCTTEQVWEAVHLALKPKSVPVPSASPLVTASAGELPFDWTVEPDGPAKLDVARDYLARGIWILPQKVGEKQPRIYWTEYQDRPPTDAELVAWFGFEWPNEGMVAVLGLGSRIFVIDVDGPEAHAILLSRLGSEPLAPKVFSGSGSPFRYHLFFRHPADFKTQNTFRPWHDQLEFKGHGGIVVLPPSEHKSGNLYRWAPGQSLDDLARIAHQGFAKRAFHSS